MRAVLRWTLPVTSFLAGMIGTGVAHLCYSLVWRIDGLIVLGVVALLALIGLLYARLGKEAAACLESLLAGISLALGILFYGWTVASLSMLGVAMLLGVLAAKASILRVIRFGIVVVICQWSIFAVEHLATGGRIFAYKWLHVDHPFFGPSEPLRVEKHGRHAIYLYDMSRCVWPNYKVVIWGWSVFPKIVDLGDEEPLGTLANHIKIREAIR